MAKQAETQLQKKMVAYLLRKGIFCWVNKNGATYDPIRRAYRSNTTLKGISDILGVMPGQGKSLAIEVKMPKKYPTKEQRWFLKTIEDHGGVAFVARSIEDLDKHLEQYYDRSAGGGGVIDI